MQSVSRLASQPSALYTNEAAPAAGTIGPTSSDMEIREVQAPSLHLSHGATHSTQSLAAARARALQLVPQHTRGNMPRLRIGVYKNWYPIKDGLKRAFINIQWNQFLQGKDPNTNDTRQEVRNALTAELQSKNIQSKSLLKKAEQYIEEKVETSQFSRNAAFSTSLYRTKGTDLLSEVIRTENGNFFQLATQMYPELAARFQSQQKKPYGGEVKLVNDKNKAKGRFGKILLAERLHETGSTVVAAKTHRNTPERMSNNATVLYREAEIYKRLPQSRHFSSVRDFAYVEHTNGGTKAYLFMDLQIRGHMASILNNLAADESLISADREKLERTIALQFIQAVSEMHGAKIYHQDIKLGNYLLSKDGAVVLTDFGTASQENAAITAGTPGFLPPEFEQPHATKLNGDKFSLGVTLAELSRKINLPGASRTKGLDSLALRLMQRDPNKRASLEEILSSDYFQGEVYSDRELLELIDRLETSRETAPKQTLNSSYIPEGAGPLELMSYGN